MMPKDQPSPTKKNTEFRHHVKMVGNQVPAMKPLKEQAFLGEGKWFLHFTNKYWGRHCQAKGFEMEEFSQQYSQNEMKCQVLEKIIGFS